MTKPNDKTRKSTPADPATNTRKSGTDNKADLYDPVGMAGKKAGIIKELEAEVRDASQEDEHASTGPDERSEPENAKRKSDEVD